MRITARPAALVPAASTLPLAVLAGMDGLNGLQSARILAARGVPVIGVVGDRHHYCARTRVPKRIIEAPTHGDGLIDALRRLALELPGSGDVFLLPCKDDAVLSISAGRAGLPERYRFVLPDHDVVMLLSDKLRFAEYAATQDWPMPRLAVIRSPEDARQAAATFEFPGVVKPPIKSFGWREHMRSKAIRVANGDEFLAVYERAVRWSDVLILQSWIEGGDDALHSCSAYLDRRSQPLATFVNRKLRQWPLDTGFGSLGVEVRNDFVRDTAIRVLSSVGYQGLGHLEIKKDARTGEFGIIEFNLGRPTVRSAIAERGGVELLMTAYSDALGLPLPTQRTQLYGGVKWIDIRHDLQASAARMRRGELTLSEWRRSIRGPKMEAVGSFRDPVPFLADILSALARVARDGSHRLLRRARAARRPPVSGGEAS
jgi:D-aspartate ligase